jgi:hypothetical protein
MIIKESDIEIILNKMNISYAEAEKALNKSNGNIDKAISYLDRKQTSIIRKIIDKINSILKKIMSYKLIITRKGELLINLPIFIIVIGTFLLSVSLDDINITPPEIIIILLIIILSDCKILIDYNNKKYTTHNNKEDNIIHSYNSYNKKDDDIISTLEVTQDDDFNEVNIEN